MPTFRKVRLFLRAYLSRRLRKLKAERDEICRACDKGFYTAYRNGLSHKVTVGLFCGECGCQAWRGSDINQNRNLYEGTVCPLKKWPGDKDREGAITLHQATELLQARDKAELNVALSLAVIDGDIKLDDRICGQLGVNTVQQLEAHKVAMEQKRSTSPKTAAVAVAGTPANVSQRAFPQGLNAEQFAAAFPIGPAVKTRRATNATAGRAALATAQGEVGFGDGL